MQAIVHLDIFSETRHPAHRTRSVIQYNKTVTLILFPVSAIPLLLHLLGKKRGYKPVTGFTAMASSNNNLPPHLRTCLLMMLVNSQHSKKLYDFFFPVWGDWRVKMRPGPWLWPSSKQPILVLLFVNAGDYSFAT